LLAAGLVHAGAAASAIGAPGQYVGASSCAAQNCHGSVSPRSESKTSLQNEYVTWHTNDRHAKAFESLRTDRGLRMAQLLGMVPATATAEDWLSQTERAGQCLDCHAVNVPGERHGERFRLDEGVTCEACHGPAGEWLVEHTEAGWEPSRSIPLGMRDLTDPAAAAATCLGCHLGSDERRVDHTLLAAGHPRLSFELDTFALNMPSHWKEHERNAGWFRGGAWAAGQAVSLRESMRMLGREGRRQEWPEFALYECSTCHHDLVTPSSRQRRGYGGRMPGTPILDSSRYAFAETLAQETAQTDDLGRRLRDVSALASRGRFGAPLERAADEIAALSNQLLGPRPRPLERDEAARLLRSIVASHDRRAYEGFGTAQQMAWALDVLAVALVGDQENHPLRREIGVLFEQLKSPSAYDPARFSRSVAIIEPLIP